MPTLANVIQVGSGVGASGGGGSTTPPGDPSGLSATIIEYYAAGAGGAGMGASAPTDYARIGLKGTVPSPIGTYAGCHVYVESPDGGSTRSQVDTATADSAVASTVFQPLDEGKYPLNSDPTYIATFGLPVDPSGPYTVRIYAVGYSPDGENQLTPQSEPGPSPSCTLVIAPGTTVVGREYADIVGDFNATSDTETVGGIVYSRVFVTFTPPSDPRWTGIWNEVVYVDDNGNIQTNIGLMSNGEGTQPCNRFPAPKTQSAHVRALSYSDPNHTTDPSDDGVNSYASGLTPEVVIPIGTTAGTINAANSFNFDTSDFHVDPATGKWSVNNVDFSKAINFDPSLFTTVGGDFSIVASGIGATQIADNAITTPKLLAGAVTTLKLTTNAISVGSNGASMPVQFTVYNHSGAAVGWIGDDVGATGYDGAWFKRLLVGGSGPSTAPFFADSSGNVIANGIYVYSASTPLGWIGTNATDTGAWFKKLSIGGTSFSNGPIKSDASGNVTISGTISAGGGLVLGPTSGPQVNISTNGLVIGSGSFSPPYGTFVCFNPSFTAFFSGNLEVQGSFKVSGAISGTRTVSLAKLTVGGANGSLTFTNGILTSATDPT